MNIKINIHAPELATAIHALANALSVKPGTVSVTQETSATSENTQQVNTSEPDKEAPKETVQEETKPKEVPAFTIEEVRAKLTAISQAGKQTQVKELISSFGASKLTEIPKEKFAEVLAAAEKI